MFGLLRTTPLYVSLAVCVGLTGATFRRAPEQIQLNDNRRPAGSVTSGVPHRLRFINMTLGRPTLRLEVRRDTTLQSWRPLAKDGRDLPAARQVTRRSSQVVSIGETYDFEFTPAAAGEFRVEVRRGSGSLLAVMLLRAS